MSQAAERGMAVITTIIEQAQIFINDNVTKETYRTSKQHFIRQGKLSFAMTVNLLLSNMCSSLQIELYKRLSSIDFPQIKASSFCKNRYKIKPNLFSDLNSLCTSMLYKLNGDSLKTWRGFTLFAIDGTALQLPDKVDVRNHFGAHKNGSSNGIITHTTMGRLLLEEDVLNKVFTRMELTPIVRSELAITYDWILSPMNKIGLRLFDRNFGGFLLMYLMLDTKQDFVIRMKTNTSNIIKVFIASGELDKVVTFTAQTTYNHNELILKKGTEMQIRLLRILLPTGEIEVLATSLLDQAEYQSEEFSALYNLRWGIETAIDVLKNKLEIMSFLAHKAQGVYQEVYATILDFNIQQLLIAPAQVVVDDKITKKKKAG